MRLKENDVVLFENGEAIVEFTAPDFVSLHVVEGIKMGQTIRLPNAEASSLVKVSAIELELRKLSPEELKSRLITVVRNDRKARRKISSSLQGGNRGSSRGSSRKEKVIDFESLTKVEL